MMKTTSMLAALVILFSVQLFAQTHDASLKTEEVRFKKYRVKKGDSLSKIAKHYHLQVADLVSSEVNPRLAKRKNPDVLYRREMINIPVPKDAVVARHESVKTNQAETLLVLVPKRNLQIMQMDLRNQDRELIYLRRTKEQLEREQRSDAKFMKIGFVFSLGLIGLVAFLMVKLKLNRETLRTSTVPAH
jgi:hypothetical protein